MALVGFGYSSPVISCAKRRIMALLERAWRSVGAFPPALYAFE